MSRNDATLPDLNPTWLQMDFNLLKDQHRIYLETLPMESYKYLTNSQLIHIGMYVTVNRPQNFNHQAPPFRIFNRVQSIPDQICA